MLLLLNGCGNSFHKRKYTAGKFKHPKDHKKASSHHRKNKKWVAENKKDNTNVKIDSQKKSSTYSESTTKEKTKEESNTKTIPHTTPNHTNDQIEVSQSEVKENNQKQKEESIDTQNKKNKSEKRWKKRSIDDTNWNTWTLVFWLTGPFLIATIVLFFLGAIGSSFVFLILSLIFGIIALTLITLSLFYTQSILSSSASLKNKGGKEIVQIFMWFFGSLAVIALIVFIILALIAIF